MFLYIVDQKCSGSRFVQASFHSIQQNRILSGAVTANRHIPVILFALYWLIPNTSRLTSNRKTAQIVTRKSTGGAYAVVSPIERRVNIIRIEESGMNIKRISE